ncbi:MAG: Gfo/Idh/MocA family oxidoreductase [Clostridia bacterium]|nr:Gfo/Idh/MocA family oxidoreductase [Clostridia bacterium]
MNKIKTVVIGCGKRANLHIPAMQKDGRFEIAALCDIKPEAIADKKAKFALDHAAEYTDYREMIAAEKPDCVVQALWPEHRLPIAKACVDGGVKLMVSEKPIAPNFGDAKAMLALAEGSDCRMMFTHQRRSSPGNLKIRELLSRGVIGEIIRVDLYANRHLLDCGTHSFDQAWSYIGDKPILWVLGALDMEKQVRWFDVPGEGSFAGTFMYEGGIYGSVFVGCPDHKRPEEMGVTLYGTKGYLEIGWEGKVYAYNCPAEFEEEAAALKNLAAWDERTCSRDNIPAMWTCIADAHLTGGACEFEIRNAYRAAEAIFALYESVRRRAIVRLPLENVEDNPLETMIKEGIL